MKSCNMNRGAGIASIPRKPAWINTRNCEIHWFVAFTACSPRCGTIYNVFINQLIECEISFRRNFYMDWNFEFLFCYLAAWHEVEPNKCKHDSQLSYNNKIRYLFNEMSFKAVCCERCGKSRRGCPKLVTFFCQPASTVHSTCKPSVSHHRTISSSPMS